MKVYPYRIAATLLAVLAPVVAAHAQLEALTGKGGMSGLSGQSLTSGSLGNVAGLLQYCIGNNYLGGESATSVKDKLTGKLPGGEQSNDPGYKDGVNGLLHSSGGQQVDLTGAGGGMKGELTRQACDTVLAQAKTML